MFSCRIRELSKSWTLLTKSSYRGCNVTSHWTKVRVALQQFVPNFSFVSSWKKEKMRLEYLDTKAIIEENDNDDILKIVKQNCNCFRACNACFAYWRLGYSWRKVKHMNIKNIKLYIPLLYKFYHKNICIE